MASITNRRAGNSTVELRLHHDDVAALRSALAAFLGSEEAQQDSLLNDNGLDLMRDLFDVVDSVRVSEAADQAVFGEGM